MYSDEIKNEAARRISNMSSEEKKAKIDAIHAEEELIKLVDESGLENLPKDQRDKFRSILKDRNDKALAFGSKTPAIENEVLKRFNISRDDIKDMAKNPYKAAVLKDALISLLLNVGTIVLGVNNLGMFVPATATATSIVATSMAKNLIRYSKYRKSKFKYIS